MIDPGSESGSTGDDQAIDITLDVSRLKLLFEDEPECLERSDADVDDVLKGGNYQFLIGGHRLQSELRSSSVSSSGNGVGSGVSIGE